MIDVQKIQTRNTLIEILQTELDTRDKRYMFLRMEFKELLPKISIEGSSHTTAWNIYDEFEKQGNKTLNSLVDIINNKFDYDLIFFRDEVK